MLELIARRLALFAGLMDFGTGVALVLMPAFTLGMMMVPVPGSEALVFVRFVGAFVGAVGASYLWALLRPIERLRVVFGATCIFRIAAGSFTLLAVCAGWLGAGWLMVTATDFFLVAAQCWLISKGGCRDA